MELINKFRSYILEDEFQIKILKNKINVTNYSSIGHFDSNKVIIYKDLDNIIINGTKLVVSKLLTDEILITGNIKNIEFR